MILEPPQTAKVEKKTLCIEEHGVKLRLTVVDTPGTYTCIIWFYFFIPKNRTNINITFTIQVLVHH